MKVDLNSAAQPIERNANPSTSLTATEIKPSITQATARPSIHETAQPATTDRTTLKSDEAVQSLVNRALQTPEVRQSAVQSLRESVSNGSYSSNASQTAAAIVSHES